MSDYLQPCSLSEILQEMQSGKISPEDLIDLLCNRIEKYDGVIKAFLPEKNRRQRLQRELQELKKRWPLPQKRPPLFGLPIGVKDIFRVADFVTKAGSKLPTEEFQGAEAEVVQQLKAAGALILGKTVTTEFAYFQPGPTRNPHNVDHTPGGSSSGSAAAVAAGLCPLALGTQTIGSISRPASFCGVYGLKPSYGFISTGGVIPFSPAVDQVGWFTQDLAGLKLVWQSLKDVEQNEARSLPKPQIGIPSQTYLQQAEADVLQHFLTIITQLQKAGYKVIYTDFLNDIEQVNLWHRKLNAYEFSQVHHDWYQKYRQLYHPRTRQLIEQGKQISSELYEKAKAARYEWREKMRQISEAEQIDLWLSPAAPTVAPAGLESTGNPVMNLPWTFCGVPTIAAPWSMLNKLPLGLQFATVYGTDEKLWEWVNYLASEFD